ncbi:DUF4097 family beta strand repeat-containing protein [Saccharopolyspora sp. 5N708]|uniref:DUF4097 family beta strand repeat-containing protein n=1 Tax=Saccharopolyspora sp. 5N708 TaxID=3457424 RepID=UPI003FD1B0AB
MPVFDTPEPISATIDVVVGDLRIIASDRADTVVEVRPSDRSKKTDVRAAEQTHVDYSDGELQIKSLKRWKHYGFRSDGGSVDVVVELPSGSHVQGDVALGDFDCEGRLGQCRFKTSTGHIRLAEAAALNVHTASGRITLDRAVGHVEVSNGSGDVRIRQIDGTAVIRNSNGHTRVGQVTGELRLRAANGDISVDRAQAAVDVKTANGNIRIGEVVRGSVVLSTAAGELEVGIHEGTAAWLDLNTVTGRVHNSLDSANGPAESEETVEVRARTYTGDIVIHRSWLTAVE